MGARFSKIITTGLFLLCCSHSQCGPEGPGMTRSSSPTWWGTTQAPDGAGAGHSWAVSQASQWGDTSRIKMPHRTALTQAPWATTSSFHFWKPYLRAWSCPSSHADFPSPPSAVLHHIQLSVWQPKHWWESVPRGAPFHPTHMHLALFLCLASDTSTL